MIYSVRCDDEVVTVKADSTLQAMQYAIADRINAELYDVSLCKAELRLDEEFEVSYDASVDAPDHMRHLVKGGNESVHPSIRLSLDQWDELHEDGVVCSTDWHG